MLLFAFYLWRRSTDEDLTVSPASTDTTAAALLHFAPNWLLQMFHQPPKCITRLQNTAKLAVAHQAGPFERDQAACHTPGFSCPCPNSAFRLFTGRMGEINPKGLGNPTCQLRLGFFFCPFTHSGLARHLSIPSSLHCQPGHTVTSANGICRVLCLSQLPNLSVFSPLRFTRT